MVSKTIWTIEDRTRAKHVILRKYLDAWIPIITRYNGRVVFLDGFAGPGVYEGGEDGSPVIALKALIEHSYKDRITSEMKFFFIEDNKKRTTSLSDLLEKMKPDIPSNAQYHVINDEYHTALDGILTSLDEEGLDLAPTFAFIDPFGVKGIPLDLVKRLMSNKSCEVLINVMIGYIHRFVDAPEFEFHCDALFGCELWKEARALTGADRENYLRNLYQAMLLDKDDGVGAEYVRYFTMKNDKNRVIYDLFFATNHSKGIDAMKDAMWKVDETGEFTFSDATDPAQVVLFGAEPRWDQLSNMLSAKFSGKEVHWPLVEEEVRRSPFRILKRPIVKVISGGGSEIINPPGTRKNTLNKETVIRFK